MQQKHSGQNNPRYQWVHLGEKALEDLMKRSVWSADPCARGRQPASASAP